MKHKVYKNLVNINWSQENHTLNLITIICIAVKRLLRKANFTKASLRSIDFLLQLLIFFILILVSFLKTFYYLLIYFMYFAENQKLIIKFKL
jgi:hypothetical protein